MVRILSRVMLAALLVVGMCRPALCGFVSGAKVLKVNVDPATGLVYVLTSATTITNSPSCATNTTWQFAFQMPTTSGQNGQTPATQLLTAAMITGTRVRLDGAGTCTASSNTEDLSDVYFGD